MIRVKPNRLHERCCKCGKVYPCYDSPMLKEELWQKICPEEDVWWQTYNRWKPFYVCAECMERVLGRSLTEDDLLLSSLTGKHVLWNTDFIRKRFPEPKFALEQDDLDLQITQYESTLDPS